MQHRARLLALFLCAAALRAASAQVVTGAVVLPDSVSPVTSGVLVEARDAKGFTIARALTSARGTFTLKLPAPGTIDLRVLRIGNRPSAGPSLTVAVGETRSVRIVYHADPISLASISVRERETCRVQSDSGLLVARLWEEARKAMLTSQLSAGDVPLFAEWIEYNRAFDSTSRIVRQQSVHTSKSPTTHAFRSVPAGVLLESGYVVTDPDATSYYAPDAEVLLSEAFVNSHCFHVVTPARDDDQGRIGIAFVPTHERANMKEIDGTLWLDRATAELRTLNFRFLNLPEAADKARPGGTVDFLRLDDGSWIVKRWAMRMPELANTSTFGAGSNLANARFAQKVVLRAVRVTGGEVIRATRHDSLVYKAIGEGIAVQVVAHDTMMSVRGARLDLEGTDYTALGDAKGLITLTPVLAGQYRARIRTALMDSLRMPPVTLDVETRAGAHVDSITLPTARSLLAKACPADAITGDEGMIHGWVKDTRAEPVSHATVVATWQDNVATLGTISGDVVTVRTRTAGGVTDTDGYWRICGMPQARLVSVSVTSDAGSDVRKVRLDGEPFAQVNLVLHKVVTAMRDIDVVTRATHARARVDLAIADTRGSPLQDVTLEILPAGGEPIIVVTGPSGHALATEVPPGVVTVRARHIGFVQGVVSATVLEGGNTIPIIMSTAANPLLDTVRVVGDRTVRGRLAEFEQRRLDKSATASFTRDDILTRNPTATWQMLSAVPSVSVKESAAGVIASPNRGAASFEGPACVYAIAIDGVVQKPVPPQRSIDLRQLPPPEQVHGMEIFAGPASVPPQYGGASDGQCGLIAIWTR